MSDYPIVHYVNQFTNNLELLLQQQDSRLVDTVFVKGGYVGKSAVPVEQFGSVAMVERTARLVPRTFTSVPTDRRWVSPRDFNLATAVDLVDQLRTLINPQAGHLLAVHAAAKRCKDQVIIDSLFADALTGQAAGTTVAWADQTAQIIAQTYGTGSTASGLNVAKLKHTMKIFMQNYVDLDNDPITCIITAAQNENLLNEIQVINSQYNGSYTRDEAGRLKRFLCFNFVHSELIPTDGTYRRVPVYAKSGMHLGMWLDLRVEINPRYDLEGNPYQLVVDTTLGATRLQEKKVVEIKSAE